MFKSRFLGHSVKKKMEKDPKEREIRWITKGRKEGMKEVFLSLFKKSVEGEVGILCALDYRNTTIYNLTLLN